MKIDCDKENDIIYIRFSRKKYDYSEEKEDILVDYDKKGKVVAIEIFEASKILKTPIEEITRFKGETVV
ncbi:MAG: DUF2283 domain-containing protein [Hadesarchaea archaeon]|nr:DUF2283 domain-containing protein [Hadesarchaea archaeon]